MSASFAYTQGIPTSFFNDSIQDKRFYQLLLLLLGLYLVIGVAIPFFKVTPLETIKTETPIQPTITQIRLQKEEPKVEVPQPEEKAAAPQPEVNKPKPTPPKAETPKKQPQPSQEALRAAAKQKAASTGLAALNQDIASLRNLNTTSNQSQAAKVIAANSSSKSTSVSERLYSTSPQGSQVDLQGQNTSANLDARLSNAPKTNIQSNGAQGNALLNDGGSLTSRQTQTAGQRDEASVRRIFDQSKASASALYNRALRKNPFLSGKVKFRVTIAPNGSVSKANIVSSELNDPALERKLLLKVKSLQFGAQNVSALTLNYTYDFVPS